MKTKVINTLFVVVLKELAHSNHFFCLWWALQFALLLPNFYFGCIPHIDLLACWDEQFFCFYSYFAK